MLVDTQVRESEGMSLQANIYYAQEKDRYTVTYEMNGEVVKTEDFPGKNLYFVEDAVANWFSGVKQLNG